MPGVPSNLPWRSAINCAVLGGAMCRSLCWAVIAPGGSSTVVRTVIVSSDSPSLGTSRSMTVGGLTGSKRRKVKLVVISGWSAANSGEAGVKTLLPARSTTRARSR